MGERISIAALRESTKGRTGHAFIREGELFALLDAVEVARWKAIPWVVDAADAGDPIAEADLALLREKFDPLDFGEPARDE